MTSRRDQHESEALLRQVDGSLLTLRERHRNSNRADAADVDRADVDRADVHRADVHRTDVDRADVDRAEHLAAHLRRLVVQTVHSSAADRARVRAAVHYFVGLPNVRTRRRRSLALDLRVVDDIVRDLTASAA